MSAVWELPVSLCVGGTDFSIRTDFRAVLDILKAFRDPDLEADERWMVCLEILYCDPVPAGMTQEAAEKAMWFINCGQEEEEDGKKRPVVMDWEQDAGMIVSAINKVAGTEIRALPHLHWWTFMSYYMEIGDGLYSTVIGIRQKKKKGKKLEKWERQFYQENKELIDLKERLTAEEREERERLEKLFS